MRWVDLADAHHSALGESEEAGREGDREEDLDFVLQDALDEIDASESSINELPRTEQHEEEKIDGGNGMTPQSLDDKLSRPEQGKKNKLGKGKGITPQSGAAALAGVVSYQESSAVMEVSKEMIEWSKETPQDDLPLFLNEDQ